MLLKFVLMTGFDIMLVVTIIFLFVHEDRFIALEEKIENNAARWVAKKIKEKRSATNRNNDRGSATR